MWRGIMDIFVARQPIFDLQRRVVAYELLFRSGAENYFPQIDGNVASSRVIHDSLHVFGLDTLAAGAKLFINITRDVLLGDLIRMLPPEIAVLELLETVVPDDEVVAACRALHADGYRFALDDFVFTPAHRPLMELADVIKIDFRATPSEERRALALRHVGPAQLLAEKVETDEDVAEAAAFGYTLLQGFFFCRPHMISAKDIPASKLNWLQLLQLTHAGDFDLARIETVVKQDVGLSVKLLRYLNAAAFGWRHRVTSIRHALVLLGERPFRKWMSLLALAGLRHEQPNELVVSALVRAHFCERLGPACRLGGRDLDLFLTGLLSLTDVLLGRPMPDVLGQLGIAGDVQAALLGGSGALGAVLGLVTAYERADWDEVDRRAKELNLDEAAVPSAYRDALEWTQKALPERTP